MLPSFWPGLGGLGDVRRIKPTAVDLHARHATDQLENPMKMRDVKQDIARMKTVLREQELTATQEE